MTNCMPKTLSCLIQLSLLAVLCLLFIIPPASAGEITPRIINGQDAPPDSWPSQARVSSGLFCAGTLIAPRWVISAAHCFSWRDEPSDVRIHLGSHNRFSGELFRAQALLRHAGYDSTNYYNDIALIQLKTPARYPRRALAKPSDQPFFSGGQDGFIAGWGTTTYGGNTLPTMLREAVVKVRSYEECLSIYGSTIFTDGMICAGGGPATADACQGDSGGPLEVMGPRGRLLVGIVSWGVGCGFEQFPGGYTNVSHYSGWIGARMIERVTAPSRKRISGSATVVIRPQTVLGLPASLGFRTKGPFRVGQSSCNNVQPNMSCSVEVRALTRRGSQGDLLIFNYAGRRIAKVALFN